MSGGQAWPTEIPPEVIRSIVAAVRSLRYGAVEITVHNSHVVQIERREKYRFATDGEAAGEGARSGSTPAIAEPSAPVAAAATAAAPNMRH